ncbi:MAG: ATP-binding protein [Gammaproteobacteria bacterium]|nr:ATP-binding protein [Gammaproteobacteria bacterium]
MSNSQNSGYEMSISLSVLDHLGLNLYSNTPAVISEVIANAWDADATHVEVVIDIATNSITITDNGHGMDLDDINNRYLRVGYRRRDEQGSETARGRSPMGRKGIGKLSLFSIANKISVHTVKVDSKPEAFLMDAVAIRRTVEEQERVVASKSEENNSEGSEIEENKRGDSNGEERNSDVPRVPRYRPQRVDFDGTDITDGSGTSVKITDLKKVQLTQGSIAGLRKRIARRFGLLDHDFKIIVNGDPVEFSDRDYFHKARFIFQYGDYDYARHCQNLDREEDSGRPLAFSRKSSFNACGVADKDGDYEATGWIAIARRSNDLDDISGDHDDNLNKITILMRGKVAQEDILQEYRLGGMITKFIFGEVHADFLDVDDDDDVATTSRQRLAEDHPRYVALKRFIETELRHIWIQTNTLKEQRALETALKSNPYVKKWYESLRPLSLKKRARIVFRGIDLANMDDRHRHEFYATAVLAFERFKLDYALEQIEQLGDTSVERFLEWLADMDAIEASRYLEIVRERLAIIGELQRKVGSNEYEKILQKYIFNHLWLLDPAWERATQYKRMEERLQNVVERVPIRDKTDVRIDVRYRRISGAHVIIELKRPSVSIRKTAIEDQVNDYVRAVEKEVEKDQEERRYPIESICLLGNLPIGWDNPKTRQRDEESLRGYGIRVMTYAELIKRAESAYAKFVEAQASVGELRDIVNAIRSYGTSAK